MNELGSYLKTLRGERSLREVAEKCGISHTYLDTLEKGYDPRTKKVRKPNPDILEKLATYYGVDYEYLMRLVGYIERRELNDEMGSYFLSKIKDTLKLLTSENMFFDDLKSDIQDLEEKYSNLLEINESITPEWLIKQATKAEYDSEWMYDLIGDLQNITEKYNLDLELNAFLLREDITYKGHVISDNEKQLITAYLDTLFTKGD